MIYKMKNKINKINKYRYKYGHRNGIHVQMLTSQITQELCNMQKQSVVPCNKKSLIYDVIYRVSQEECAILRESVPYVKLYRYNPKHLYPKLNGYGDNGQRKVGTS